MSKIPFVILGAVACFILEYLLFNQFGKWFTPNLLLLFVIFINIFFGIRYSISAAIVSGILRDSFSTGVFGTYMLAYICSAFLTTTIRRYLFHTSPYILRVLLALVQSVIFVIIVFFIQVVNSDLMPRDFLDVMAFVLLPEVFITTLVSGIFFRNLKKCVLRFSE